MHSRVIMLAWNAKLPALNLKVKQPLDTLWYKIYLSGDLLWLFLLYSLGLAKDFLNSFHSLFPRGSCYRCRLYFCHPQWISCSFYLLIKQMLPLNTILNYLIVHITLVNSHCLDFLNYMKVYIFYDRALLNLSWQTVITCSSEILGVTLHI